MNKTTSTLLTAAVTGLFLGSVATLSSCTKTSDTKTEGGAMAVAEKHACKGLNSCAGKGGCSTGDKSCATKNSCKGKGGCATVAKHECAKKNACKGQGGCKTSDGGCAGKNTCTGKGGCAVPVKAH
jgi:hypothetical protein